MGTSGFARFAHSAHPSLSPLTCEVFTNCLCWLDNSGPTTVVSVLDNRGGGGLPHASTRAATEPAGDVHEKSLRGRLHLRCASIAEPDGLDFQLAVPGARLPTREDRHGPCADGLLLNQQEGAGRRHSYSTTQRKDPPTCLRRAAVRHRGALDSHAPAPHARRA
jgi:hypothetical protein